MSNKKCIYTGLSIDQLMFILNNKFAKTENMDKIIIKFTATWCNPCKKIKTLCDELFQKTSENTTCFNLDIDSEINAKLYSTLKAKKMIRGVPTLLGFNCKKERDMNYWYVPDISVVGANENEIRHFFSRFM
jgi:thiol-disulfide isomerase/thioredoxin